MFRKYLNTYSCFKKTCIRSPISKVFEFDLIQKECKCLRIQCAQSLKTFCTYQTRLKKFNRSISLTSINYLSYFEENKELGQFWEEESAKDGYKNRCISKISSTLNCDENESIKLLNTNPGLFYDKIDLTVEKIEFVKSKNVPISIIKNNIAVLKLTKYELMSRLALMEDWNLTESQRNELFALCQLTSSRFKRVSCKLIEEKHLIPYGNRVVFLAKTLECSLEKIALEILRCPVILCKDFKTIQRNIKLYEEYGVTKAVMSKNLKCFNYTGDRIKSRLKIAKERGITKGVTPYIVQCSESKMESWLKNQENEQVLLTRHASREAYLADKLKVNVNVLKMIMKKHARISRMNPVKLREMTRFLTSEGYTGLQILATPRILFYNIYTIKERLAELRNHGYSDPTLLTLCKTEKEFQKILEYQTYHQSSK